MALPELAGFSLDLCRRFSLKWITRPSLFQSCSLTTAAMLYSRGLCVVRRRTRHHVSYIVELRSPLNITNRGVARMCTLKERDTCGQNRKCSQPWKSAPKPYVTPLQLSTGGQERGWFSNWHTNRDFGVVVQRLHCSGMIGHIP